MSTLDAACLSCKAGFHDECAAAWDGTLDDTQACCCGGKYDIVDHYLQLNEDQGSGESKSRTVPKIGQAPQEKRTGQSGYIHQDAWRGTGNIGELKDAASTGRKRAAEMFPITVGMVCEWANLEHAGGGVSPIRGCLGNPATDIHHGPDKNTLNNSKVSWGVGEDENIHLICSQCHNTWHGRNDESYPEYDRQADQWMPWVPEGAWDVHDGETRASLEDLQSEQAARRKEDERHGRERRGRGGHGAGRATDYVGDDDADTE